MKFHTKLVLLLSGTCLLLQGCGGAADQSTASPNGAPTAQPNSAAISVNDNGFAPQTALTDIAAPVLSGADSAALSSAGVTSGSANVATAPGSASGSVNAVTAPGATGASAIALPVASATELTTSTSSATALALAAPLSYYDAWRLADQATFGPTESLVATIKSQGAAGWIASQVATNQSRYTSGGTAAVHQFAGDGDICDATPSPTCWRDNMSNLPLVWDFYRNATTKADQLRQRVAFALQQILVVSSLDLQGTYGFRNYNNSLLANAFGNYREVLRQVIQSPVMGDYLNHVNNDQAAPNENFGRELLQLFTVGTCDLNSDGSLRTGRCLPTYGNDTVRAYAYALTGWTYPAGGTTSYGCWPAGTNCRFYTGDMVPAESLHDRQERALLAGVKIPAGQGAQAALNYVLDSLMGHPNMAPFIGRQLIQHLVSANPSAAYVGRVAAAFSSGRFMSGATAFGSGQRGDLAATVAAILLDAEARGPAQAATSGKLREPVLLFTGVIRQLNGSTDGEAFSHWWGDLMRQHVFRPPSVFNFYPPDFPVPGTGLVGPSFALHGASASLQRLNFLTQMIDWDGIDPDTSVPSATGSHVNLAAFITDAADAPKLVDRLSLLAIGEPLSTTKRAKVIEAVQTWGSTSDADKLERVKSAAYLVLASPDYQVQR